ncbi:52 kDa repressor of the inhibitor of the protein kinase-like [Sipha flava]|uniref:52 kDa repressor of the inhibitor of the protein kinase-like n=1 Tax=Sipha flava TaxID=143950 RepID=A0A8B8GJI3_9HEMI|nr:52 kDa repressor of the inhibitor of the protein kinase-like [Sipha flava]
MCRSIVCKPKRETVRTRQMFGGTLFKVNELWSRTDASIANEIIEVLRDVIVEDIVRELNNSKYFAILCDETTDISTKEQITFSVRYIDMNKFVIKEEFFGFTELLSNTSLIIKDVILKQIDAFVLNMTNLWGQGYDGGSNMSGINNEVQALILNEHPLALYTHCFNHVLNLAISKACNIPAIRNIFGIVGSVSVFLSASAKHRHDPIITFHELYKFILISLEELEKDTNREISAKASSFNSSVKQSEFVVALETVTNLFVYTRSLSIQLQISKQNLSSAMKNFKNILNVFEDIRKNPDITFITLFEITAQKLLIFDEELKVSRLSGHQTKRNNINANINQNPMEWFKITIIIPFLDHIIQELKSRFTDKFVKVIPLEGLIPIHKDSYSTEAILRVNAAMFYDQDLLSNSDLVLKAEINLWKTKWNKIETNIPHTAVTSLPYCEEYFPNIKILLQLFATLPVSTSTAERSHSTLRRLKNYMRSTMTESRLNGLALLNIHKDKHIDIDIVTRKKKRKMQLEDWSV